MAEAATKLPVKTEAKETSPAAPRGWQALENLRQDVGRLFDNFPSTFWRSPFRSPLFDVGPLWPRNQSWNAVPAVDIVEKDNAYEITAELPGMDEKNVEVTSSEGMLMIKGEKEESKEEKEKDYHLSERRYGSFRRTFSVPAGVDANKIEATFKKGVLTVTLPKSTDAQKKEKKIAVASK